jgi:ABC-type branched-subunit amino acid transport system substrate-binding protein
MQYSFEKFWKGGETVKSKMLFISLAVVLALSLVLTGCPTNGGPGPTPSDTIVLSASVSATGVLKDIHDLAKKPIAETYVALYPTITVGSTTFDVELDFRDDASVLANMLDNTDDILDDIATGAAHFLLGPTCTAFLEAQAPKATTAKVVQMTMEGGATSLFSNLDNYEYSFVNLSFSNWFEIPVLAKMLAEAKDPGDTAYVGYQNDDHGLEYSSEAGKYFAKEGITIDGYYAMNSGDTGANGALIAAAKAAGSDILCVFAYPEHVFGTAAVAKALAYDPKAVILGPGGNFGVYAVAIAGNASEGVMSFATANNKTAGNAGTVISTIENAVGFPYTDYWGHPCYWAALDFIYAGAAAEGDDNDGDGFTIDQNDFRSYCAGTKLDSAFGETWYVTPDHALNATEYSWDDTELQWPVPEGYAGLMNYKCHTGEIGQWQSGYFEIVGYSDIATITDEYELTNYYVTANFTYPKPVWP